MHRWIDQSTFTSPGRFAEHLAVLGPAPEQAAAAIQGLLIHGEAFEWYGLAPRPFSRETLPVKMRLAECLAADNRPLNVERALQDRAGGTCRDYAVLMCAAMRQHGRPARVRCGFAAYFAPNCWQDHWICEVWSDSRWRRIDAQLDDVARTALGVGFDPYDLSPEVYRTADEVWRDCRAGRVDPDVAGHDRERGLWFVYVNLVRDRLALVERMTSAWDGWRAAAKARPGLSRTIIAEGDRLASEELPGAPARQPSWWIPA
jgi:hypothetical protein